MKCKGSSGITIRGNLAIKYYFIKEKLYPNLTDSKYQELWPFGFALQHACSKDGYGY